MSLTHSGIAASDGLGSARAWAATALWPLLLGFVAMVLGAPLAQAQEPADMTIYVFKKGLPQQNIEVLVDGVVVDVTDPAGAVRLALDPGLRRLELRDQDLVVLDQQILANEGELSQWIVNITRGLSSLVDVESSAAGAAAIAAATETQTGGDPGTLSGLLLSADDGRPVEGARVFISGQSSDVRTGADGRFELEVPSGTYSVSVLHASFNTQTRDDIEVPAGGEASLELQLTPSGSELPEFVVIEPYIAGSLASVLEERRTELAVANILGAEQISKAGDSDAAGALRRVTGLTLVDGRFIYIRGLGERYSSTLLNNANVPSPDPTRRVVPLDLFPTSIVDSIAVKKGYTSELPGEFGGGVVELRTKSIPETPFFDIEFGLGYRDGTTFKEGLRYQGSSSDWTGHDGGIRQQSPELMAAIGDGDKLVPFNRFTGEGFTREELQVVGRSLPVIYDADREDIPVNIDGSVAGGYSWDFPDGSRFGFLAAVEYKDDWLSTQQRRTQFTVSGGELAVNRDLRVENTFRNINNSWFFTAGLDLKENHQLSYNWMLLRNTLDQTQIEQGLLPDAVGGEVRFTELRWEEREMKANQFLGEHLFPGAGGLKINWQYTLAKAAADEPDYRRYRYDPDRTTPEEDDFLFSLRNDSNQRRWSELDDTSDSWNVDFILPLELTDSVDLALMTGFNQVDKSREVEIRRFAFFCRGSLCRQRDLLANPSVEDIIFEDTILPTGWQIEEITNRTDAYTGGQDIEAWSLGLDLNLNDNVRIGGGFRDETSSLFVTTFDIFDPGGIPVVTEQVTDDIFPYATFTWFKGDHQIRAGWAETINRPDFKELSPAQYRDPLLDRIVQGNPNLQPAFITHYDIRWDYYFNPGEFISFGFFLKEFVSPIEITILASAGARLTTFDNAETAENFGFEFEFYKTLDIVDDLWDWGEWWGNVYINTNYAWIESEITLADDPSTIQTTDQRPLQGQSPYVWNFQVGYDDLDRDINIALLYNVFGARIVEVGVQGAPDLYEQPRPSLDLVYSQGFGDWRLKAKIRNLLDPALEVTQGNEVAQRIEPVGAEFSIGFQYTFR